MKFSFFQILLQKYYKLKTSGSRTKRSEIDEYGFKRNETFDYAAYETFMSEYIGVLAKRAKKWTGILPLFTAKNNPAWAKSKKVKRYLRKGIPIDHRPQIWMIISNAAELKKSIHQARHYGTGGYYAFMLNNKILDPDIGETIRTDLPRTFPENIFFRNSLEHQQQLSRILKVFALDEKDIGYCQGLNYIAALILLVTKHEENTYWIFRSVVNKYFSDYYTKTLTGVVRDIDVLSELVRIKMPHLYDHIAKVGVPWPVIATKWFICMFADVLPVETVLRIWDCLFVEGPKILFRVALTLLKLNERALLDCDDFSTLVDCMKSMTRAPAVLNCHSFMSQIFKIPGTLKRSTIDTLRTEVEKKLSQERLKQKRMSVKTTIRDR
uniref:Growth hormone-regulated TBC protein 1 n=2 Tax=Cacopsylla melanoneura TaxID=428564 RepID=A0A8D9EUY4_9HEMI